MFCCTCHCHSLRILISSIAKCKEQGTLKDPCQSNSLYMCNCVVHPCMGSAGTHLRPDIEKLSCNVKGVKTKGEEFFFSLCAPLFSCGGNYHWVVSQLFSPFEILVQEKCFVMIRQNYFPYFVTGRSSVPVNDLSVGQLRNKSVTFNY